MDLCRSPLPHIRDHLLVDRWIDLPPPQEGFSILIDRYDRQMDAWLESLMCPTHKGDFASVDGWMDGWMDRWGGISAVPPTHIRDPLFVDTWIDIPPTTRRDYLFRSIDDVPPPAKTYLENIYMQWNMYNTYGSWVNVNYSTTKTSGCSSFPAPAEPPSGRCPHAPRN